METPQANDTTPTTDTGPSSEASAPVNHEARGIEAVKGALAEAFAGLESETPATTTTTTEDSAGDVDIDAMLANFEKAAEEPAAEKKSEEKAPDDAADPFKKIGENWDPELADLLRAQAEEIKALKAQISTDGRKTKSEATAGPSPLESYIAELIPKTNALASAANLPRVTKLVDRSASVVAQALAAARPPSTPAEHAAIEREAIGIVVSRLTGQTKPARTERAAPAKSIPPGGSAAGPSAHRSAPSHMDRGVAAIAEAMRTLG